MSAWHPFAESIRLHVPKRITEEEARRQETTAREILNRLKKQPGVVLADEVGMGKTFVALAVAASVALSDKQRRPVVVMVPPGLKEKWPQDCALFTKKCLPLELARRVRAESADSVVAFLKLLDDPIERRSSIIFLTHGAMNTGLGRGTAGGWVKLALIKRCVYRRKHLGWLRRLLHRRLGDVLEMGAIHRDQPGLWEDLLAAPCSKWLDLLRKRGINPEGDDPGTFDDDPVPQHVERTLERFDPSRLEAVLEALHEIPIRDSTNYAERLANARRAINDALRELWRDCLQGLNFRLPVLILDEAHHLKNAKTRLASLFHVQDADGDAEQISARGALGGVFERMLFLTATPFQLGHQELCSVLDRFDGIAWDSPDAPTPGRPVYRDSIRTLQERLDAAQHAALNLDADWGRLRPDDLVAADQTYDDVEAWWNQLQIGASRTPAADQVVSTYEKAFEKMRAAEELLRPWVIRHLKPRFLANGRLRREYLPGAAIAHDKASDGDAGLQVSGAALLPFLLAARATMSAPDSRPVFAEGLASSYEAFLDTRKSAEDATDGDDDPIYLPDGDDDAADRNQNDKRIGRWYLKQLKAALPLRDHNDSAAHPKVSATARRVLAAWRQGQKVLVFCHYIATGRVLRQVISGLMNDEIVRLGAERIKCTMDEVLPHLERLGDRFDNDSSGRPSPARRASDAHVSELLKLYPTLQQDHYREKLLDVTRRYLRTPSFLVRYFPLNRERLDEAAVADAFAMDDGSGLSLRAVLGDFFEFLEARCEDFERQRYLDAIRTIQTGRITGREAAESFSKDERKQAVTHDGTNVMLLPNVRLVNGPTLHDTRQRLMLTFNSPFFPEVLIASSVMAEGVDLHRFCLYVIHHDLCWNPSMLEQRTGRIDRIGGKVEQCGQPIRVYLPYLAETQDEKMYRVVMDRERWFNVVMGEQFRTDTRSTDSLARRVPLPASLAQKLAFRLEVTSYEGMPRN